MGVVHIARGRSRKSDFIEVRETNAITALDTQIRERVPTSKNPSHQCLGENIGTHLIQKSEHTGSENKKKWSFSALSTRAFNGEFKSYQLKDELRNMLSAYLKLRVYVDNGKTEG